MFVTILPGIIGFVSGVLISRAYRTQNFTFVWLVNFFSLLIGVGYGYYVGIHQ